MRRVFVVVAVCAVLLLLTAPVAFGASMRSIKAEYLRPPVARPQPSAQTFIPLARRLTGAATVSAAVYKPGNVASVGGTARLIVYAPDGTVAYRRDALTDASGNVSFPAVPGTSGGGEILYVPPTADGPFAYDIWDLSWDDPAGKSFVLSTGSVPVTLYAGGPWGKYFSYAWIDSFTSDADATKLAQRGLQRYTSSAPTTYGAAQALGGTLDAMNVYFFVDEGVEVETSGQTVTPGFSSPDGVTATESAAQRIVNTTWASGKPGSSFKLKFGGFPAGWVNQLTGDDAGTSRSVDRSFGSWTSAGTSSQTKTLTIPRTATPGYTYSVRALHTNGPKGEFGLALSEPFQVCTLIPSENPVRRYHKLRISGKVPFQAGKSKRVILYRRYTAAGQPPYAGGFRSYRGWTKIATTWANGVGGKYTFPRMWPSRTAWYCVWYPKDNQHWGAWTSVVKIVKK